MRQRINIIRTIIFFFIGSVLALAPCKAELAIDISLNANYLEASDIWGGGAAFHFAFANYAFELVPSGAYYVASDDTTDTRSFGLEGRANLFSIGFLRPYMGVGFVRVTQSDINKTILNLMGGLHLRLGSDRTVPFIEAEYRTADSFDPWRFRAGLTQLPAPG
jgi:hypothetical protein